MSDPSFAVSLPVMGEVTDDLVAFRRFLAEQIESVQHTVMALGSDWGGVARDAQLEFFSELRAGLTKVDEGLAQFRDSVAAAKGHYETAIATNKSMWEAG